MTLNTLDDRNAQLDEKLEHNPIDQQIQALFRADRRRRIQLIFLAALSFGLVFVTIRTSQIAGQAESNEAALAARCDITNQARAKNERLWDFIIDQSKNVPRDAEKQKTFDEFVALKNETFAPTDCTQPVKSK